MIIRTSVPLKEDIKKIVVKEEVKIEEFVPKKKNNNKKVVTPTPVVEELVVEVVEEDKIDLSEWLKEEDIED